MAATKLSGKIIRLVIVDITGRAITSLPREEVPNRASEMEEKTREEKRLALRCSDIIKQAEAGGVRRGLSTCSDFHGPNSSEGGSVIS